MSPERERLHNLFPDLDFATQALRRKYKEERQRRLRDDGEDQYLETFNRENVELVDVSDSKGVERNTQSGVVANGAAYEVDCIIYATGFEITTSAHRRVDFDTPGRNAEDAWVEQIVALAGAG